MVKWLGGLGVVVVGVVAVFGWRMTSQPDASGPTLELASAGSSSFAITTTATGELEARNQIEVRSTLETQAGIVELVAEGTRVKQGDVLIKLDTASIQDQLNERRLRVVDAQAAVDAARSALSIQESENASKVRAGLLRIDLARLALDQWKQGDDPKMILQLQLEIDQAKKDLDRLKERWELAVTLREQEFLSANELQLDELAYDKAVARLQTAELDREAYEQYQRKRDEQTKVSDVAEAEADLERIREQNEINLRQKQADLDAKSERLKLEQEKLAQLEAQFEAATITAARDGLVVYATSLERNMFRGGGESGPLQIGQTVRPNDLLMVLPDTNEMVAMVRVHESLAGRIRPGQTARVRVDAAGDEVFLGRVESIGVLAETGGWRDPNRREYTVRVALDAANNKSERLKPSMRAEAEITLGSVENALAIPVQAVFNDGPVRFVYQPEGDRFVRKPVSVGRVSDTMAEVSAGLAQGDRVLLRQPLPGEILDQPWSDAALAAVGLARNDEGQIIRTAAPGGPGGPGQQGGPARGSRPDRAAGSAPGGA